MILHTRGKEKFTKKQLTTIAMSIANHEIQM